MNVHPATDSTDDAHACCLAEAVLNALPFPVSIHDEDRFLYANPFWLESVGLKREELAHVRISDVAHADSIEASALRRRMLLTDAQSLRDVHIKVNTRSGDVIRAVVEPRRIAFGGDRIAIAQIVTHGNDRHLVDRVDPPAGVPIVPLTAPGACMHEAALDVIPVPIALHNTDHFVFGNAICRAWLGIDHSIAGIPVTGFTHPDGAAAGEQRRRYLHEHQGALRHLALKLTRADGTVLYVDGDASPLAFRGDSLVLIRIHRFRLSGA